ncbi:tripartite tricarboxylate transporter substrate binding protein [Roseomonas hellenica]|uniref:Tripartite tricarboxylate transporter substrate binding protein n=1 Tax=Plastoroseomonas hellenica TaxID=2687306 RepID=A0ABS5F8W8_9PROT|nr:tripartite tricarboxylate transporter substrate binding protein [Plastoroseomonas hellenica]MBR0669009.1 tripartite tricarboxylate transporter substrate binding protein [Plastoroseomonas hellenica]
MDPTKQSISRRAAVATLAGLAAAPRPSRAQGEFPSRPVRVIVPFPPGQAADVFARIVADELSKRWPQRVVVENRAGGAGAIGMEAIARAPADGYTLGVGTSGTLGVNPSVLPGIRYDAERDFTPITNLVLVPLVIAVNPAFPVATVQDLVAHIRANPGQEFGSAGPATAQHMAAELFAYRAGLSMVHVPYRGSGPAMTDLVAGNIKLMFDSTTSALPQIQAGRVRALAVTTPQRLAQLPNVPTVAETVASDYAAMGWSGLVAPAGTPAEVARKINADVVAILRDPAVVARMAESGTIADPGTPEQFAQFIQSEIAKWREVARVANVRLEG